MDDWLIHQTSEAYNGSSVGVVSRYVDSNRWNGSVTDVLKYFLREFNPPEPDPEPPTGEGMYKIEMLGNLTIRKEPRIGASITGEYAIKGEVYFSNAWKGDWAQIVKNGVIGWIASGQWTKVTEVNPEPEVPIELSDKEKLNRLWNAHKELH